MSRKPTAGLFRLAFAPVLVAMALAPAAGCGDTKLGAPCSLPATEPSPTTYHVDTNALACASRICLLPAEQITTDTGPLCAQTCQTDADCADAQARDSTDATDRRCKGSFRCQPIPLVPDTSGPVSCQKMCTCSDFLLESAPPPASCS